jgi:Phage integrase, N-terminal SAM-like domain
MPRPPKLLDCVRATIRLKHYSMRTEEAYIQWVRRFILFHGKRHPQEMGAREVEAFLTFGGRGASVVFNPEPGPQRHSLSLQGGAWG